MIIRQMIGFMVVMGVSKKGRRREKEGIPFELKNGSNGRDGVNGYNLIAMIWQHTEQEKMAL